MTVLQNNTNCTYKHGDIILKAGEVLDVPKKVAAIWLKVKDIVEYVDPAKAKAAAEKAADEYKALEEKYNALQADYNKAVKEIEKLKAALEKAAK